MGLGYGRSLLRWPHTSQTDPPLFRPPLPLNSSPPPFCTPPMVLSLSVCCLDSAPKGWLRPSCQCSLLLGQNKHSCFTSTVRLWRSVLALTALRIGPWITPSSCFVSSSSLHYCRLPALPTTASSGIPPVDPWGANKSLYECRAVVMQKCPSMHSPLCNCLKKW